MIFEIEYVSLRTAFKFVLTLLFVLSVALLVASVSMWGILQLLPLDVNEWYIPVGIWSVWMLFVIRYVHHRWGIGNYDTPDDDLQNDYTPHVKDRYK